MGLTPYRKISVNIASATVEMIRTSELRNRRKIGGFFGADRIRPSEYFMSFRLPGGRRYGLLRESMMDDLTLWLLITRELDGVRVLRAHLIPQR